MSEDFTPDPPQVRARLHTSAVERRGRWPGVVWAIPLAALLVVAYLGVQALLNRGVEVVVTFKTSGGALVGQTPVIYKGVTVGHVVRIRIAENARDVDMTLRLEPRAKPHLRDGAKFWLIGAEPSLTDLSSLKAAVSGVSIGVSPGTGAPRDHFVGMDQPPAVPPDTPGSLYVLNGAEVGSTRVGSGVYYHGLPVGRISRVEIHDSQTMRLVVFVNAPFDNLVHPGTLFFNANAANVTVGGGHLSASIGPGSSVITGGIEFDTPATADHQAKSPPGSAFRFYTSEFQAAQQPRGPEIHYRALFAGASQKPQEDAPVWLAGVRVGRVLDARLVLTPGATEPSTAVDLELEPVAMGLPEVADTRSGTDQALGGLLRGGYRLQMGEYPPLVGAANLTFQKTAATKHAALDGDRIPTGGAAGLDELTGKAGALLDKVNGMPFQAIGENVRQLTARLAAIASSPELADSLHKLNGTLTSVDQITAEVKPQVGPLVAKLNQTADQLQSLAQNANAVMGGGRGGQDANLPDAIVQVTDAARSIRDLADYLGRHPEAVLSGKHKSKDDGP